MRPMHECDIQARLEQHRNRRLLNHIALLEARVRELQAKLDQREQVVSHWLTTLSNPPEEPHV